MTRELVEFHATLMLGFRKSTARSILTGIVVLLGAHLAMAQQKVPSIMPPSDVPAKIAVPSGLEPVLLAHASGSQIYTCQVGADGKFTWTLKAPDAELRDGDGKVVGHHSAGPSWKLSDGSEVTGKVAEHADSPDSIPWLLLNVVSHAGNGLLTQVTTIHRLHTRGGKPPAAGCDDSHKGAETKSSYTADYYFYAPKR